MESFVEKIANFVTKHKIAVGITVVIIFIALFIGTLFETGVFKKKETNTNTVPKPIEWDNTTENTMTNETTNNTPIENGEIEEKIDPDTKLPYNEETNPWLPDTTFSRVDGTNLQNGLVITNGNNYYTWIIVPKSVLNSATMYSEVDSTLKVYTASYNDSKYTDTWYEESGLSEENYELLYKKMLHNIKKYGGFWISQYEAGIAGDEESRTENANKMQKAIYKSGLKPYTFLNCKKAEDLAFSDGNDEYTSSLLFGLHWNLVCKYIETYSNLSMEDIKTDSKTWGNFSNASFEVTKNEYNLDPSVSGNWKTVFTSYTKALESSVLFETGSTERNSVLNIYDFAGNVAEWTLTKSSDPQNPCTYRGGNYSVNSSIYPANSYVNTDLSNSYYYIGFRTVLYK